MLAKMPPYARTSSQVVTDYFVCVICMERLDDPRMCRTCSKMCCKTCIDEWMSHGQRSCPHCRRQLSGEDFVKCRWVEELMQVIETTSMKALTPSTSSSGSSNRADNSSSTDVAVSGSDHAASSAADACAAHPREPVSIYCRPCKVCICYRCAVFDEHKNHNFRPLEEVHEERVASLRNKLESVKKRMHYISHVLVSAERNQAHLRHAREVRMTEARQALASIEVAFERELIEKTDILRSHSNRLEHEVRCLRSLVRNTEQQLTGYCSKRRTVEKADDWLKELELTQLPPLRQFHVPYIRPHFPHPFTPDYEHATFAVVNFHIARTDSRPLFSDTLTICGAVWRLKIYPDGNGLARGTHLSAFLELHACGATQQQCGTQQYEYRIELCHQGRQADGTDANVRLNYARDCISKFELNDSWGYNRFFELERLERDGYWHASTDTVKFRFYIRSPTYAAKCKEVERYAREMELTSEQLRHDNRRLLTQIDALKKSSTSHRCDINKSVKLKAPQHLRCTTLAAMRHHDRMRGAAPAKLLIADRIACSTSSVVSLHSRCRSTFDDDADDLTARDVNDDDVVAASSSNPVNTDVHNNHLLTKTAPPRRRKRNNQQQLLHHDDDAAVACGSSSELRGCAASNGNDTRRSPAGQHDIVPRRTRNTINNNNMPLLLVQSEHTISAVDSALNRLYTVRDAANAWRTNDNNTDQQQVKSDGNNALQADLWSTLDFLADPSSIEQHTPNFSGYHDKAEDEDHLLTSEAEGETNTLTGRDNDDEQHYVDYAVQHLLTPLQTQQHQRERLLLLNQTISLDSFASPDSASPVMVADNNSTGTYRLKQFDLDFTALSTATRPSESAAARADLLSPPTRRSSTSSSATFTHETEQQISKALADVLNISTSNVLASGDSGATMRIAEAEAFDNELTGYDELQNSANRLTLHTSSGLTELDCLGGNVACSRRKSLGDAAANPVAVEPFLSANGELSCLVNNDAALVVDDGLEDDDDDDCSSALASNDSEGEDEYNENDLCSFLNPSSSELELTFDNAEALCGSNVHAARPAIKSNNNNSVVGVERKT